MPYPNLLKMLGGLHPKLFKKLSLYVLLRRSTYGAPKPEEGTQQQ